MLKYESNHFSDLASTELGISIWSLLNKKDNIIRLETATELKRPAAEAVSTELLNAFGKEVKADRVKQMIGHMIRQIMEARNYHLDNQGVKVKTGGLFTKASRYIRSK